MAFTLNLQAPLARPSLRRSVRAAKVAPTASLRKVRARAHLAGLPQEQRRTRAQLCPRIIAPARTLLTPLPTRRPPRS